MGIYIIAYIIFFDSFFRAHTHVKHARAYATNLIHGLIYFYGTL